MNVSQSSPQAVRTHLSLGDDGFEYLVVTLAPGNATSAGRRAASAAKEVISERTDKGAWELQRTVLYTGGVSRHWMRRRVTKVVSTLS